jgi:hypothetical protein
LKNFENYKIRNVVSFSNLLRNIPEGKLDKKGKSLKFHRDLDSDWVVQKDTPHLISKEA